MNAPMRPAPICDHPKSIQAANPPANRPTP